MKEAALSPPWKISGRVILSLKAAGSEQNQSATQRQEGWSRAKELWKGNFGDLCAGCKQTLVPLNMMARVQLSQGQLKV